MKNIFLFSFLTLVLLTSCEEKKPVRIAEETVIPVKVMNIEKLIFSPEYHVSGLFTTEDETNLAFKNGGILQAIYVKEGDAVKKGQVLAVLEDTEINTYLKQAESGLSKATRDYERASNLYKDSVATLEQMQNAKTALEVAEQNLEQIQISKKHNVLFATQSGYVLQKFAHVGQIIGPGMPVLRINGAADGKWILKAGVSDRQWAAIQPGDSAEISTDIYPGKILKGIVTKKSEGTNPMTGSFTVSVTLQGFQPDLAAGLFGKALIRSRNQQSQWKIPFNSILDGEGNKGYVFVPREDGTAEKIEITIDRPENGGVLIREGLENVKFIITEGGPYLTEGSRIRILS